MDSSTLSYILGGLCVVIALVELYFLHRMIHALRPLRSENHLADIEQGRSHFRFVPENIGPLSFAASTHYVPTFLSVKEKSKFVGLTILYVTLSAALTGVLAYLLWDNRETWATSAIVMSVVTLLLLALLLCILVVYAWKYIPHKCRRQAIDLFVGRDGVAVYTFKNTREQLVDDKTLPFACVHNILRKRTAASSQKNRIEYTYIGNLDSSETDNDKELLKLRTTHHTSLNKPAMLQFLEAADTAYATWHQTQKEADRERREAEAEEQRRRIEAEEERRRAEAAAELERVKKSEPGNYFSTTTYV